MSESGRMMMVERDGKYTSRNQPELTPTIAVFQEITLALGKDFCRAF